MKFEKGDKIKRISYENPPVIVGGIYIVVASDDCTVALEGLDGLYDCSLFKLEEKAQQTYSIYH